MKLWRFCDPESDDYACYDGEGKWREIVHVDRLCPSCTGASSKIRVPGLTVEWMPGSSQVADFTWDYTGCWPVVTQPVLKALSSQFDGILAGPIEMVQKKKKPKRMTKRTKPRVWLPYEGEPLFELRAKRYVAIDYDRSTVKVKECEGCSRIEYDVRGIEISKTKFDKETWTLVPDHRPRVPGEGIFVRNSHMAGEDIFYVAALRGDVICTDRVRDFVLEQSYTNVTFLEVGDVVE
jgi:hypothetical protein